MDTASTPSDRIHCLRPLPAESEALSTSGHISNAMVRLLRARTGRGPTKAKTEISPELALVTVGDFLTAGEKTLLAAGHGPLAMKFRAALHEALREEAIAVVEAVTGRRVAAYLTAQQLDPELAVMAFHFEARVNGTR